MDTASPDRRVVSATAGVRKIRCTRSRNARSQPNLSRTAGPSKMIWMTTSVRVPIASRLNVSDFPNGIPRAIVFTGRRQLSVAFNGEIPILNELLLRFLSSAPENRSPSACDSFKNVSASGRPANVTGSGVRSFARSVKAVAVHLRPARPPWNPIV